MQVSVVIPCHNGVELTRACISALVEQRGAAPMEIVVVDNDSADSTALLDREFTQVRTLRQSQNHGFAGGVNRGIAAAHGDAILVINNDTRPAPHMLERLVLALQTDAQIGAVAPVSNHVKGPARLEVGNAGATADGAASIEAALHEHFPGRRQDVDTLAGLCLLVPRAVLQRVGPFDERFGLGNFEDDDFSLRARLLGLRLVLARDAFLHHEGHRTFQALGLDYSASLLARYADFATKWRGDPVGDAVLAQVEGNLERAAALAAAGLRAHPRWLDGHWLLGRRALLRGDYATAERHLRAFVAVCPDHGQARTLLAVSQMRNGNAAHGTAELAEAFDKCYLSDETAAQALAQLGRYWFDQGEPRRAIEPLRSAVSLRPDDGELHNALGAALLRADQPGPAREHLEAATQRGAAHAETNLGVCLWQLGEADAALAVLTRAAMAAPHDPMAQANLRAARAAQPPARATSITSSR